MRAYKISAIIHRMSVTHVKGARKSKSPETAAAAWMRREITPAVVP